MASFILAPRARRIAAALPLSALALGACASSTSSRAYQMDKAPYYRGDLPAPGARIALLPVAAPAVRTFRGDPAAPPQLRAFLDTLDNRLTTIVAGPRLSDEARAALVDGAPRVRFGCDAPDEPTTSFRGGLYSPGCNEVDETMGRHNQLDVTGGTKAWRERVGAALDAAGADYLLITALEMSDQWAVQKGWSITKEVRLGTGYSKGIPWLSSLETPVSVVQLTGMLVDRTGKVRRSGAEGLLAVQAGSAASLMGIQKAVSDEDIARLRVGLRRDDLPGAPLVWESALETLVAQLAGGAQVQVRR